MLIKHHGMHWERYTFTKKNKFELLGVPFGQSNDGVNFTNHTGVYVLENMLQNPVYIGSSKKLGNRLEYHVKEGHTHNSWDYFSWFSVSEADQDDPAIDLAMRIESILIRFLNPRLNRKEESLGNQYWQKEEDIYTLNGLTLSWLEKIGRDA